MAAAELDTEQRPWAAANLPRAKPCCPRRGLARTLHPRLSHPSPAPAPRRAPSALPAALGSAVLAPCGQAPRYVSLVVTANPVLFAARAVVSPSHGTAAKPMARYPAPQPRLPNYTVDTSVVLEPWSPLALSRSPPALPCPLHSQFPACLSRPQRTSRLQWPLPFVQPYRDPKPRRTSSPGWGCPKDLLGRTSLRACSW